jgi:5-methylcytosine-specific restriction protein A
MTAVPRATRELVLARDAFGCVSCGRHVGGMTDYSVHHRIPRGMGGSTDERLNRPSNLILSVRQRHHRLSRLVESRRNDARTWGYLLYRLSEPSAVAVYTYLGWTMYHDDGSVAHPPPPNVSDDKIRELARDVERAREQRMRGAA